MSKENNVIVVEEKLVPFQGDNIAAAKAEDGMIYIPIRPLCDYLGVDWAAQRRRINRDDVLVRYMRTVAVTATVDGKQREMICLPLKYLAGWLFGISTKRVKSELREKLIEYQEKCFDVLHQAFTQNEVVARPDEELMQAASPEGEAYRIALAVAKLARQQYYLSKRVEGNEKQLKTLDQRLALVEANLGDDKRFVTKEQASNISQGVRAIALVLTKRSGKNEYGGVYGELYRYVGVSSYKEIPAVRYDKAMSWLRNWYIELTDESDLPF